MTFTVWRHKSILRLILGGAAVHRCDKQHISNVGFSRRGNTAARKILFRSRLALSTRPTLSVIPPSNRPVGF
jgi:hypothetical protein